MTSHFGFTKLVVQDLDAMSAFYKEVASLVEMARVQDVVGDRQIDEIMFNATGEGGATFVLFKFLDRDTPVQEEVILGFQTDDVASFVERAEKAGGKVVQPIEVKEAHGVKDAFVTDPEGHLIEVVELLSR